MTHMTSDPARREIAGSCLIDAPPEIVWEASLKPELIRRWWVCPTMSMPVCDVDPRVGGAYRFVGRDADGLEIPMKGVYQEVVPFERVVHTEIFDVEPYNQHEALVTVTLQARGGKTELVSRIVFPSPEIFEGAAATGMETGMGLALDRLAALAERLAADAE